MNLTPTKLEGKDFEAILMAAAEKTPGVHMTRYGTKAVTIEDVAASKVAGRRVSKLVATPSLPDFDIALSGGRQVIIEAKVCGTGTFPMLKDKIKPSQVEHMLARAALGVPCWLLIHWTERIAPASGRSLDPACTVALPVGDAFHPRWRQFVNAHHVAKKMKANPQPQPAITRAESLEQGQRVAWIKPPRCINAVPDLAALLGVKEAQPTLL